MPHTGPGDWQPVGLLAELPDGHIVRRHAGDVEVLVVRRGRDVSVLSNRCPHLSAPLHEGELDCSGAAAEITCPWHGSVFRIDDGTPRRSRPDTPGRPKRAHTTVDGGVGG